MSLSAPPKKSKIVYVQVNKKMKTTQFKSMLTTSRAYYYGSILPHMQNTNTVHRRFESYLSMNIIYSE